MEKQLAEYQAKQKAAAHQPTRLFLALLATILLASSILASEDLGASTQTGQETIDIPGEPAHSDLQVSATEPSTTQPTRTSTTVTQTTATSTSMSEPETSLTTSTETSFTTITQPSPSTSMTLPQPLWQEPAEELYVKENGNSPKRRLEVNAPSFSASFSQEALADEGVEVSTGGAILNFKPKARGRTAEALSGKHLKKALADKNRVRYQGVYSDGIDVEYEAQPDTLKERITLRDYGSVKDLIVDGELALEFTLNNSENTFLSLDGETEWDGQPISTQNKIYVMLKPQAGVIYTSNKPITILEPYAIDAGGRKTDLSYTLEKKEDGLTLSVRAPKEYLEKARYPVVLDPTIQIGTKNLFLWQNLGSCSTSSSDCDNIYSSFTNAWFHVDPFCISAGQGVNKLLIRFNITCIPTSKISSARLYYNGKCINNGNMTHGDLISLYRINSFSGLPSTCNGYDSDENTLARITGLMSKYTCFGAGKKYVDITSHLADAKQNSDGYIAFKIDIDPPLESNEQPGCNNCGYYFSVVKGGSDLYLTYELSCLHTSECGGCVSEYCRADGKCTPKNTTSSDCTQPDIDGSRDSVCSSNHCVQDTFDYAGDWYCAYQGQCVYDANQYDSGTIICDAWNSYKQCNSGTWSGSIQCPANQECKNGGCTPLPNLKILNFKIEEVRA